MSDIQYNLQFEKLCNILKLGDIVGVPKAILGGLLNRMYVIETTQGKYAIKALNPQIMLRPTAMQNYINSELIANIAAKSISAVPAKIFAEKSIQEIDGQYYLVFDWVDGRSLKQNEINISHCEKIGTILANIHKIDFSELGFVDNYSSEKKLTDWSFYLQKGIETDAVWVDTMRENIDNLYAWDSQFATAAKMLSANTVISHRDLDPKNIMWYNGNPVIIDWEASGFINPMHDLFETAIYWAKDESENIDKDKFFAFIGAYRKKCPALISDWKTVLQKGYCCNWLEYSLKRSLRIECIDEAEQQMGTEHVTGSINALRQYANEITVLEEWLSVLSNPKK